MLDFNRVGLARRSSKLLHIPSPDPNPSPPQLHSSGSLGMTLGAPYPVPQAPTEANPTCYPFTTWPTTSSAPPAAAQRRLPGYDSCQQHK
jgi:hypothetical protein